MEEDAQVIKQKFDVLWKSDDEESYKSMIELISPLADAGDGGAMGRLGRARRDGKGVRKDLSKAAYWMRRACDENVKWAPKELFDILWEIGTPESYKEMIEVISPLADAGDGGAMGRLGKSYKYGKGVDKNLTKASILLENAMKCNVKWANIELAEVLWEIGTPETCKEMIGVVEPLANNNNPEAMELLSLAYRYGKGVEKNPILANSWRRRASFNRK